MIIRPQCLVCILNRRLNEISNSKLEEKEKLQAQRHIIKKCSSMLRKELTTNELASILYSEVKKLLEEEDPYKEFKKKAYKIVNKFSKNFENKISKLNFEEKIKKIVTVSSFMNFLDPSTKFGLSPEEALTKIYSSKLVRNEVDELIHYLSRAKKVLIILDNAGEAAIDLLLVKELSKMGLDIKILAKGKPYQNDVTYEEAKKLGFNSYGSLISTKTDSEGIIEELVPKNIIKLLKKTDLIIAKGVANLESFYYKKPQKPTFNILATKCEVISNIIGTKIGETVAFFYVKPII